MSYINMIKENTWSAISRNNSDFQVILPQIFLFQSRLLTLIFPVSARNKKVQISSFNPLPLSFAFHLYIRNWRCQEIEIYTLYFIQLTTHSCVLPICLLQEEKVGCAYIFTNTVRIVSASAGKKAIIFNLQWFV